MIHSVEFNFPTEAGTFLVAATAVVDGDQVGITALTVLAEHAGKVAQFIAGDAAASYQLDGSGPPVVDTRPSMTNKQQHNDDDDQRTAPDAGETSRRAQAEQREAYDDDAEVVPEPGDGREGTVERRTSTRQAPTPNTGGTPPTAV